MFFSIQTFLVVYFVLFFGVAVAWRSFRVWQLTGVNAFRLREEAGPEMITGRFSNGCRCSLSLCLACMGCGRNCIVNWA